MQVPISPTENVDETTLFEDPLDPAKKFTIPRFELLEETIDAHRRLGVLMEKVGETWVLTVRFVAAQRAAGVASLPLNVSAILRFKQSEMVKEVPLTIQPVDPTRWTATYTMTTLNEMSQIYNALTHVEFDPRFVVRCSASVAIPVPSSTSQGELLYSRQTRTIDVFLNRDPFFFSLQLDAAVFSGITDVPNKSFGFFPRAVEYQGRQHHYYQDEAQAWVFRYLPDSFKMTRRASRLDPQRLVPAIMVKFSSPEGSLELEKMRASLTYTAAPVVDNHRKELAREALKPHLPSPLPANVQGADLQMMIVAKLEQLKLNVTISRSDGGNVELGRPGIVLNLTDSFSDIIDMPVRPDFENVWDALFGKSAVIVNGQVVVQGGDQHSDDVVPFTARLQDLVGDVIEESEEPGTNGSVNVTLRNCIESPVIINSIPTPSIIADGQLVAAHFENLTKNGAAAQFPIRLAANEKLSLQVVPDQPLPSAAKLDAVYNLDDVTVEPDAEAIWAEIVDDSVPAQHTRLVTVKSFADWFAPATDVTAIIIDFASGDPVVLDRDHLEGVAKVRIPLADIILRKEQEPEYRYTMTVIRGVNQTRVERIDRVDILTPNVNS